MDQPPIIEMPIQQRPAAGVGRIGRVFSILALAMMAMMLLLRPG
jgi:hypothetical protein